MTINSVDDDSAPIGPSQDRDLKSGRLMGESSEIAYVAGTHWAAIYDEVCDSLTN